MWNEPEVTMCNCECGCPENAESLSDLCVYCSMGFCFADDEDYYNHTGMNSDETFDDYN